jgi:hypothetical protein
MRYIARMNKNDIFEAAADGLIKSGANDETKRAVLGPLLGQLGVEKWDGAIWSADMYKDDPVILELFDEAGVDVSDLLPPTGIVEVKLYANESPEGGWHEALPELRQSLPWPEDDDRWRLNRILYEIEVNTEVDIESGSCRIVGVNGVRLEKPLPWNGPAPTDS